jgi:hypothetical protein
MLLIQNQNNFLIILHIITKEKREQKEIGAPCYYEIYVSWLQLLQHDKLIKGVYILLISIVTSIIIYCIITFISCTTVTLHFFHFFEGLFDRGRSSKFPMRVIHESWVSGMVGRRAQRK